MSDCVAITERYVGQQHAKVDVRFNGQSVTLQKPKEPGSPG
jgi:hypothetical protein